MVVNIFLESSALQFAISVIGVLVFIGLTAYDTQATKTNMRTTLMKKPRVSSLSLARFGSTSTL